MTAELKMEDIVVVVDGKVAKRSALITAHYLGWLEDGTQFDAPHRRNAPFQCMVSK